MALWCMFFMIFLKKGLWDGNFVEFMDGMSMYATSYSNGDGYEGVHSLSIASHGIKFN